MHVLYIQYRTGENRNLRRQMHRQSNYRDQLFAAVRLMPCTCQQDAAAIGRLSPNIGWRSVSWLSFRFHCIWRSDQCCTFECRIEKCDGKDKNRVSSTQISRKWDVAKFKYINVHAFSILALSTLNYAISLVTFARWRLTTQSTSPLTRIFAVGS